MQPTFPATAKQAPRVGNLGHLTRIANKLVQLGSNDNRIQGYLEGHLLQSTMELDLFLNMFVLTMSKLAILLSKIRIGFIGLENMGSRMVDSLIKAGYEVAVHDINQDVVKMFSDKGILIEDSFKSCRDK
ncbi:hypothetical protein P3S68_004036 [Capsicum galapagoense]